MATRKKKKSVGDRVIRGAAYVAAGVAVPIALAIRAVRGRPAVKKGLKTAERSIRKAKSTARKAAKAIEHPARVRSTLKKTLAKKKAARRATSPR